MGSFKFTWTKANWRNSNLENQQEKKAPKPSTD